VDKTEILARLRELKSELHKRYKVNDIGLFGSFARTEEHESSDIDILVEFEKGADLLDFVALADFLEESLGRQVDLVTKNALRPEMRDRISLEASMA